MAKTTQVLKLHHYGNREYQVIFRWNDATNQFWLYQITEGYETDGVYHTRKKCIAKYANLASCLCHLADLANNRSL